MMSKVKNTFFLCILVVHSIFSQSTIEVAEKTLKIAGNGGEEVFYYGFAEGDQLIFDFEEVNGKELKEIEIQEYPGSSKFMDYKSKKIVHKKLSVAKTAVYKFRFTNSATGGRVCKIKIQRKPSKKEAIGFNTSVFWRTTQDTIYIPFEEKYLFRSDTFAKEIYSGNPQVSSRNALNGNKNQQVVDFVLPENTVSWSFYIGTGKEGSAEFDRARADFLKSTVAVAKYVGYDPMAILALTGISYFNQVQGADNVKYWFLDETSKALFENEQNFSDFKKGDVVNEASQMKTPLSGKVYLGLLNDNIMDPIKVTIKVTAVAVEQEWKTRIVQKMSVTNREEPYLK
jgi:hypothetical protein